MRTTILTRLDAQHFAERTLALLLDNWCAVEALIEGEQVEQIIDRSMSAS
jgi:hypothetical protein